MSTGHSALSTDFQYPRFSLGDFEINELRFTDSSGLILRSSLGHYFFNPNLAVHYVSRLGHDLTSRGVEGKHQTVSGNMPVRRSALDHEQHVLKLKIINGFHAMLFTTDGQLLLIREGTKPLGLVGGKPNEYEHYFDALIREFREETGLTIRMPDAPPSYCHSFPEISDLGLTRMWRCHYNCFVIPDDLVVWLQDNLGGNAVLCPIPLLSNAIDLGEIQDYVGRAVMHAMTCYPRLEKLVARRPSANEASHDHT